MREQTLEAIEHALAQDNFHCNSMKADGLTIWEAVLIHKKVEAVFQAKIRAFRLINEMQKSNRYSPVLVSNE